MARRTVLALAFVLCAGGMIGTAACSSNANSGPGVSQTTDQTGAPNSVPGQGPQNTLGTQAPGHDSQTTLGNQSPNQTDATVKP